MTIDDATRLVLREGFATEGSISLRLRMAEEPPPEQLAALFEALELIQGDLRGRTTIDGKLAYALFGLSFHVQGQFDAWLSRGWKIRDGFGEEMARLFELIEDIFLEVAGDLSEFVE